VRLIVTSVEFAPEELHDQVPFVVELIRQLPGADRDDYWLGSVVLPLEWWVDGEERSVRHVVLAARHAGARIEPGVRGLRVGIAFVTDSSLLEDREFDSAKCEYVAIGECNDPAVDEP
jgi:hypothetical protein